MLREKLQNREEGFTLIELLVVVIIIGILAAIAIPTFLNQRERGWQAELSSTVRNIALEVEAEATKHGGDYTKVKGATTTTFDGFVQEALTKLQAGATPVAIKTYTPTVTGFKICGTHTSLTSAGKTTHNVTYDSLTGGLADYTDTAACAT